MKSRACFLVLLIGFAAAVPVGGQDASQVDDLKKRLVLETKTSGPGKVSTGYFRTFENRRAGKGREIKLDLVVLHATGDKPQPDPVFVLAGGPGQAAATLWRQYQNSWMRRDRDIVLVNQRGTGGDNRIQLPPRSDITSPQDYLRPMFEPERIKKALKVLNKKFDLRMYSTPDAMDDLNEIRQALGYEKINLTGGSYGTRAALVYIRRHEATVRTAVLNGVAPIEFRNPLYHAQEAQNALDKIFAEVEANQTYREAFPNLRKKFDTVLERLEKSPAKVELQDARSGEVHAVEISKDIFCGSLRFQMYYLNTTRSVPLLIQRAYEGDFKPFARNSIARNRALGNAIALGMLLSVTAAEDVARIKAEEIGPATKGSFYGDSRLRNQIEVCRLWPKSDLPKNFGDPVKSNVPTLILSGIIDPVTGPRWGEVVHKNFPNSIHIVAPAAHGVGGSCIQRIQKAFLDSATVKDLDTSCVKDMKLPPLVLPK